MPIPFKHCSVHWILVQGLWLCSLFGLCFIPNEKFQNVPSTSLLSLSLSLPHIDMCQCEHAHMQTTTSCPCSSIHWMVSLAAFLAFFFFFLGCQVFDVFNIAFNLFNFKRLMKVFLSLCNFYPGQFLFLTIVTWIWSHRFSIQIYVRVPFQKVLASNGLQICLGWYTCNQCHNQCKKGCRFIFCRWSWGCACIIH